MCLFNIRLGEWEWGGNSARLQKEINNTQNNLRKFWPRLQWWGLSQQPFMPSKAGEGAVTPTLWNARTLSHPAVTEPGWDLSLIRSKTQLEFRGGLKSHLVGEVSGWVWRRQQKRGTKVYLLKNFNDHSPDFCAGRQFCNWLGLILLGAQPSKPNAKLNLQQQWVWGEQYSLIFLNFPVKF
jgi:hypothetical protein